MQQQTIIRQAKGQPTGGQFAAQNRTEATISLGIGGGDQLADLTGVQARAVAEEYLAKLDLATEDLENATDPFEEALAGGRRSAYAEAVARLTVDELPEGVESYEQLGEIVLDGRNAGHVVEIESGADWPGPISALRRQMVVDHFRTRADDLWVLSQRSDVRPDVEAHFASQFETFSELSLDLSADGAFGV